VQANTNLEMPIHQHKPSMALAREGKF